MKDYFTIGELSDLFNINTQTLRYYDSIGLFTPVKRDEQTGYRYYQFNQLYQLASIRYLRKLDYSIGDIDSFMKARKVESVLDRFKEQSRILHEKWDELIQIDNILQRKIAFIEEELPHVDFKGFKIREFGARSYLPIGSEDVLYGSDIFYFYPTIAFYRGNDKYFGALLQGVEDPKSKELVAGRYLCGYHKGPYDTIEKTIRKMYKGSHGLKLDDVTINFNVIDQFVENDANHYVTSIQILIHE